MCQSIIVPAAMISIYVYVGHILFYLNLLEKDLYKQNFELSFF